MEVRENVMKDLEYQCCFCGDKINSGNIDITSIIIISNWDKDKNMQQEQQLFCHIECLKKHLSKNTHIYISDIFD